MGSEMCIRDRYGQSDCSIQSLYADDQISQSVVCWSYRDLCGWACNCTWFPGNSPVGLLAECIPDSDDLYGMCPESGTDTYL